MLPLTRRNRDRIVDREVLMFRLREARRRLATDQRSDREKPSPHPDA